MPVGRPLAQVVDPDVEEAGLDRPAQQALAERRLDDRGEDREDVDAPGPRLTLAWSGGPAHDASGRRRRATAGGSDGADRSGGPGHRRARDRRGHGTPTEAPGDTYDRSAGARDRSARRLD